MSSSRSRPPPRDKPSQRRRTGRPPLTFSDAQLEVVRKLARVHCTISEIAAALEVTERCVYLWMKREPFASVYHQGRAEGQVLIRQLQFQSAARGCTQMLIHLGKQYLGQNEQPQTVVNVSTTGGFKALTAEQQKDLERLYTDIQKRALSRAKREMESWEWPQRN